MCIEILHIIPDMYKYSEKYTYLSVEGDNT